MKTEAIYSGTFDPFTKGHLDIVNRALKVYDSIIIAVAISQNKKPMFTIKQRISFIQKALKGYNNIQVVPFNTLLIDFARKYKVYNIIRGLRTTTDFEYELQMSYANNSLEKKINTVFFTTSSKHSFISSSLVRELLRFDGKIKHLLPKKIYKDITVQYKKGINNVHNN